MVLFIIRLAMVIEKAGLNECNSCKIPMESKLKLSKENPSPLVDATFYRSLVGSPLVDATLYGVLFLGIVGYKV
jgi:hypothetical protein